MPIGSAMGLSRPSIDNIVLSGEHNHCIENGKVYFGFRTADKRRYWCLIVAGNNTRLVHEEHHTIELKPGNYGVIRQREYMKTMADGRFRSYWVYD